MTKIFGGEASLVGQVALLSGQDGYIELHWQRFCASAELRANIKLYLDGGASIVPLAVAKPTRRPSVKQSFIKFYSQVFGFGEEAAAAVNGQKLSGDAALPHLSSSLPILGEDILSLKVAIQSIAAFWPNETAPYAWSDVSGIKIPRGHIRPTGAYIINHTGEQNSDSQHKGKSYNDVLDIMKFMTPKEYVILWAYTLWSQEQYLDQSGWTRLCATWPDGLIVYGYSCSRRLSLYDDFRDYRGPGSGPREVSFVPVT